MGGTKGGRSLLPIFFRSFTACERPASMRGLGIFLRKRGSCDAPHTSGSGTAKTTRDFSGFATTIQTSSFCERRQAATCSQRLPTSADENQQIQRDSTRVGATGPILTVHRGPILMVPRGPIIMVPRGPILRAPAPALYLADDPTAYAVISSAHQMRIR